jgi:hypothetical protein
MAYVIELRNKMIYKNNYWIPSWDPHRRLTEYGLLTIMPQPSKYPICDQRNGKII